MDVASALRMRRDLRPGDAADYARVLADARGTALVLANAYDSGFSVFWHRGARLALDLFDAAWRPSSARGPERLGAAFDAVVSGFVASARSLESPEAFEPEIFDPATSLLAVALDGREASVTWIGETQLDVVRSGRVVARATPHTLRAEYLARGIEDVDDVPPVITRCIPGNGAPPEHLALGALESGDRLVLRSAAVSRALDDTALVSLVAGDAATSARAIVDATFPSPKAVIAACLVAVVT